MHPDGLGWGPCFHSPPTFQEGGGGGGEGMISRIHRGSQMIWTEGDGVSDITDEYTRLPLFLERRDSGNGGGTNSVNYRQYPP